MKKTIVYIDMDDCLCDFKGAYVKHKKLYPDIAYPQSTPGFFEGLEPIDEAIETVQWMTQKECLDIYILSAPSVKNAHCYTEKRNWVENHLGFELVNRLIISPHKNLNKGDYLIDDNLKGKGQNCFEGTLIHFGSNDFPNWSSIKDFFHELVCNANKDSLEVALKSFERVKLKVPLNLDDANQHSIIQHPKILAFRAFDMRDRFREPVETFKDALELLQSGRAYMPDWQAEIICYLRDGRSITIPDHFYLRTEPFFTSISEAEKWVLERQKDIDKKGRGHKNLSFILGAGITNPNLPVEEQINEAANEEITSIVDPEENEKVCSEVNKWLYKAIDDLPLKDD